MTWIISLEAYLEPYQKSKIYRFVKIINGFHLLTILVRHSILDVRQDSEYAFDLIARQCTCDITTYANIFFAFCLNSERIKMNNRSTINPTRPGSRKINARQFRMTTML